MNNVTVAILALVVGFVIGTHFSVAYHAGDLNK